MAGIFHDRGKGAIRGPSGAVTVPDPTNVIMANRSFIGFQPITGHDDERQSKACALAGGKAAQIAWPSCTWNPLESWCRNQGHDRVPRGFDTKRNALSFRYLDLKIFLAGAEGLEQGRHNLANRESNFRR